MFYQVAWMDKHTESVVRTQSISLINQSYQPILSTKLINQSYQPILSTSTKLINQYYQPILSTNPINQTYRPNEANNRNHIFSYFVLKVVCVKSTRYQVISVGCQWEDRWKITLLSNRWRDIFPSPLQRKSLRSRIWFGFWDNVMKLWTVEHWFIKKRIVKK